MKKIISYHTFMLPFTFKGDFDETTEWIYKLYNIEDSQAYNEYIYFYRHVQDALFNTKASDREFSKYFEYKVQSGAYIIDCKDRSYKLIVDGISLRIFQTGVAILSFNLLNKAYTKEEDILAINDYGRRIYPSYLDITKGIQGTKETLLANSITLNLDGEKAITEDFSRFETVNSKTVEQLLPSFITTLVEKNFKTSIEPIIDDRMFVISQFNSEEIGNRLQKLNKDDTYAYSSSDFWYKYVFVDGNGKTCQSRHMTKKLIAESTYDRWVEYGTLFGISRYSFVALSGGEFGETTLNAHIRTIYFQMFTLLLAYRATIIKFSDEIQNTTDNKENKGISKKTRQLYKQYLDFLNKLYFKEITAQDQGIELYNKAMEVMDIPKYMHDLDNEMNELHSYMDMIEEKKTAQKMNTLTELGTLFLPGTFIAGLLGMNVLPSGISSWLITLITFGGIYYITKKITQQYDIDLKKFFIPKKKEHHE